MKEKEKKRVPQLRFPEFTDDWEQRKLEDYIVEYYEVTTENNQYPALTSSRKGIFLQTEYFAGNQIASEDNTGYNVVPYGYFTYRHMSDDEIFHFNINDIVENGIVSTLYPVFTTTDELDSRYLQYQLNHGHEFARFAVLQKQGGSRTYMYLSKLKQLSLTMPKSVDEQKQISGFFMELDHLITLHQRKLEKLKKLKKGLVQKLFSQEVRFKADDGSEFPEWEEKKLGEFGTFIKGAALSKADISEYGSPFILYGELYTTYKEVAYNIQRRTQAIVDKKYYSCIGDVVIPTSGESAEEISTATCVMVPNVILGGDLNIFRSDIVDGRIMSYILNHQVKWKIAMIAQGKSIVHIQAKQLSNIYVKYPVSKVEQQKIADCLSLLDDVIEKQKVTLSAWEEMKKGLLQQMFV